MMLPEERACYIDLMIFQHQHGPIPDDPKRVLMYCTGINEATLKATLKAKFKLGNKGWVNHRLESVISDRKKRSKIQSINGTIGQFWKKSKKILSEKKYDLLKKTYSNYSNEAFLKIIKDKEINKATLEALLKHSLSPRVENENENINENINKEIGGVGEREEKAFAFDSEKFKEAFLKYRSYLMKSHGRSIDPYQEEAMNRRISSMTRSEAHAIQILEANISNGWKTLNFVDEESKEKKYTSSDFEL